MKSCNDSGGSGGGSSGSSGSGGVWLVLFNMYSIIWYKYNIDVCVSNNPVCRIYLLYYSTWISIRRYYK